MMNNILILANIRLQYTLIIKKIQSTLLCIATELVKDKIQTYVIIIVTIGCLLIIIKYDKYLQSRKNKKRIKDENIKEKAI